MNIAYTMAADRGNTDLLLVQLAETLAAHGITCCGTVQINTDCPTGHCDMDVKVLPDGPILRISQNLGSGSKGCRLDPSVLEEAVELVAHRLTTGPDLLIINKFGKHEAEGRGFRTLIADALMRDMPVLVGLNALNLPAFEAFVGAEVTRLEPTCDALFTWCQNKVSQMRSAA